jgi:hypothetical protein
VIYTGAEKLILDALVERMVELGAIRSIVVGRKKIVRVFAGQRYQISLRSRNAVDV